MQLEAAAALLCRRRPRGRLLVVSSAFYLWLGFMSAIPHKEERFLYVVYPQACSPKGFGRCPVLQRLAALAPNARSTARNDTQPFMLHAAAADIEMGQAFAFSR